MLFRVPLSEQFFEFMRRPYAKNGVAGEIGEGINRDMSSETGRSLAGQDSVAVVGIAVFACNPV